MQSALSLSRSLFPIVKLKHTQLLAQSRFQVNDKSTVLIGSAVTTLPQIRVHLPFVFSQMRNYMCICLLDKGLV